MTEMNAIRCGRRRSKIHPQWVPATVLLLATYIAFASTAPAEDFTFFAFGDQPYEATRGEYEKKLKPLIQRINDGGARFTVHVGDIEGANDEGVGCLDKNRPEDLEEIFRGLKAPLFYTPGDNEWADCREVGVPRLKKLRELFFSQSKFDQYKKRGFDVQTQRDFQGIIENIRFVHHGVLFVTLHLIAPYGPRERDHGIGEELVNITSKSADWFDDSIEYGKSRNVRGMIFATQAEIFALAEPDEGICDRGDTPSGHPEGYADLPKKFKEAVKSLDVPVLFIVGDGHAYRNCPVDNVQNLRFVEVPSGTGRAVKIRVMGGDSVHFEPSKFPTVD